MKNYVLIIKEWLTLYLILPLVHLQADHGQENIYGGTMWTRQSPKEDQKSADPHSTENWLRIRSPTLMINWNCFPFIPLKIVMAEHDLWSWSPDKSSPSPQIVSSSEWNTFPFYWLLVLNYWLLSSKQVILSSVVIWGAILEAGRLPRQPLSSLLLFTTLSAHTQMCFVALGGNYMWAGLLCSPSDSLPLFWAYHRCLGDMH